MQINKVRKTNILCLKKVIKTNTNLRSTYTFKTADLWVYMNCGTVWHSVLGNFHLCNFADTARTGSFCVTIKSGSLDMLYACTPPFINARWGLTSLGKTTYTGGFVSLVPNNPNSWATSPCERWFWLLDPLRKGVSLYLETTLWNFGFDPSLRRLLGTTFLKSDCCHAPYTLVKTKCMTHWRLWLSCQIGPLREDQFKYE